MANLVSVTTWRDVHALTLWPGDGEYVGVSFPADDHEGNALVTGAVARKDIAARIEW